MRTTSPPLLTVTQSSFQYCFSLELWAVGLLFSSCSERQAPGGRVGTAPTGRARPRTPPGGPAGQHRQPALAAEDRLQKHQWIAAALQLTQLISTLLAHLARGQQPLQRRALRVVPPPDPTAIPLAAFQLERRLKKVRKQPQGSSSSPSTWAASRLTSR